jgi:hypothetical protein
MAEGFPISFCPPPFRCLRIEPQLEPVLEHRPSSVCYVQTSWQGITWPAVPEILEDKVLGIASGPYYCLMVICDRWVLLQVGEKPAPTVSADLTTSRELEGVHRLGTRRFRDLT